MYTKPNIAIIIPAAGTSKRMGTPKQLLPWGETTLLGHAITEALQSEIKEVVVILGAHEAIIKKEIEQHPVTILNNENWENGLGSSIACGVQYLFKTNSTIDGLLVMLADQPLIDHRYLNSLIQSFQNKQHKVIATSYGKRAGVPAVLGKPYFKALSALHDDYGAKFLIEKHATDVITLNPGKILVDIDTEADYKKVYGERL